MAIPNHERTLADLDEIDVGIVRLLQSDGRIATAQLSRELGVSEPTIRKRIERLLADEIICITAVLNPHRTGFASNVLIMLKVHSSKVFEVGELLATHERVVYLGYTTGEFDLLVEMLFHSDNELFEFMRTELSQIDGIISTSTSHVVRSRRVDYRWTLDSGRAGNANLGGADLRLLDRTAPARRATRSARESSTD